LEGADDGGEDFEHAAGDAADSDERALAGADFAGQGFHGSGGFFEAADGGEEDFALRSGAGALAGAVQQADAEAALEGLDLGGERGLGHAEPGGGAAEMPLLHHGEEMAETFDQAEVHGDRFFVLPGAVNRI